MLPDFPDVKNHVRRLVLRAIRDQIPQYEPLLGDVGHSRIHEGRSALLTRQDLSTDEIQFERIGVEFELSRDQMKRTTVDQLLEHASKMAEQFAEQQARLMFARISAAVEEVGNAVSAAELGTKEAFLEMQRRLEIEFDAETLEPKNVVLVMHPDQVESFIAQAKQWEEDPAFAEEMGRIRQQQIQDWRARENRRTLVD
jgi:hypothetical protein